MPEPSTVPLAALFDEYLNLAPLAPSDRAVASVLRRELDVTVGGVTAKWTDQWVQDLKGREGLAPGTIRKRVECLARALDWYNRRSYPAGDAPPNPLRSLPRGYSAYRTGDAEVSRRDVERDRRLAPGEDARIQGELAGDMLLLYRLIVNTGLRLREAYTLRTENLRFDLRTIHVAKGKTGVARDVPMLRCVYGWLEERTSFGQLFPFWDGRPETLAATSSRLSHAFAGVFLRAGCAGLTEHDLRHEATCRWMEMKDSEGRWLFRPEEVRRITGHKTERMFMRYLSLRGSDLAERLW